MAAQVRNKVNGTQGDYILKYDPAACLFLDERDPRSRR